MKILLTRRSTLTIKISLSEPELTARGVFSKILEYNFYSWGIYQAQFLLKKKQCYKVLTKTTLRQNKSARGLSNNIGCYPDKMVASFGSVNKKIFTNQSIKCCHCTRIEAGNPQQNQFVVISFFFHRFSISFAIKKTKGFFPFT